MKTSLAVQCVVLLACMAFCSSLVIPKCRCLTKSKWVDVSRITDVQEFGLRPHCNKREVIVTLTDRSERCLDPGTKFAKALLRIIKKLKRGDNNTVSQQKTTASPTASPTAAPTATPTAAPTAAPTS